MCMKTSEASLVCQTEQATGTVFRLANLPREMHSKFTLKGNWIRNLYPQGWNLYFNINTTKTFRGSHCLSERLSPPKAVCTYSSCFSV